ncbi:hypothetical protein VL4N_03640 [Vagococcus lutrae]|uniref:HEPN domain-containing protein n=1 Tax=Vagococcus lutrae TaxID=81947 RepID=UPI00192967A4|nr:HEPN domain-containing protein [Vagococcus lutrae]GEQ61142.1 hypothetical protein VL2N_04780 [Vagococcus lutrae]GEQ63047.1 hypothetical protein VL3N_04890 [Vagococcus lutrae]GEQ64814.1 hypothetical protein VL4N_03640 [Vagococcus lutrae]
MTYTEFEDTLYDNINNISCINNSFQNLNTNDPIRIHLTNYLIIRSCGTIEQGMKLLISNHFSAKTTDRYLKNFIENSVMKNSKNPSENLVNDFLKQFDNNKKINCLYDRYSNINKKQLYSSLDSLRNLRNQIAHGDRVSTSHNTVNKYLDSSILLLLLIKEILEAEYI